MKDKTDSTATTDTTTTAQEYLSSQLSLEREARDLMPYDPKQCTYNMGPTRQQVYACLTCRDNNKDGQLNGVCYSCSIQCHSEHDLVELFTKRGFTCDCGTTRVSFPCTLRHGVKDDIPESDTTYNHNYNGKFCVCARDYNPTEETGNMLQCSFGDVCNEDWYHDYCIMGIPKIGASSEKDHGINQLDTLGEPGLDAESSFIKDEEGGEPGEQTIDGFPKFEDFDGFICWKCISKHRDFFDKIKNNKSIMADSLQRIESRSIEERKKKLEERDDHPQASKKRKLEYEYSLFLKDNQEQNFKTLYDTTSDQQIKAFLDEFPFLMHDTPIYEPPQDSDDDGSSVYDLGTRAINSLPREQAIEGVQVYENIRSKLKDFLTPFAQDGKVVNKEDIEAFFDNLKRDKK